jgi:ferrous iron transport protein A
MRNRKQFNTIEGKEVCMMPLSMVGTGEENTIQRIGGKEETRKFLETLGFVVGGKVTVVSQTEGNLIVNIKESRVAIGKDMANKIMV